MIEVRDGNELYLFEVREEKSSAWMRLGKK
jgi:hypothetical protein